MFKTYISFGSNLGDKKSNCETAIKKIEAHPNSGLLRVSPFYETEPLLLTDQKEPNEWFINGVIELYTSLKPEGLLQFLLDVEIKLGRPKNRSKWVPRVIDLDLLFFENWVIKDAGLELPHPELHKRKFVLKPLADLDASLIHPVFQTSIKTLLQGLDDKQKVMILG